MITLHKKKWLSHCSYILHENSIKNHLEIINRTLDTFNTKYKNILISGNFNVYADVETMKNFAVPMVYIVSTNSQDVIKIQRSQKLLAIDIFKIFKMRGLWIF